MKILLDIQSLQGESRFRGIGRWTLDHAKSFIKVAEKDDVFLLINDSGFEGGARVREIFKDILPENRILTYSLPFSLFNNQKNWIEYNTLRKNRIRAAEYLREIFISIVNPDFVLIYGYFDSFFSISSVKEYFDQKTGVVIYDFIPLNDKANYLTGWREEWYSRKLEHLKKADVLFAISEYVKNETENLFKSDSLVVTSVNSDASEFWDRITYSDEEIERFKIKYDASKKFILYAGGLDERKNVKSLISAYAALDEKIKEEYALLIVCGRDEARKKALKLYADSLGGCGGVKFFGNVSDDELRMAYNLCSLFVFPSFEEGFGLPPLEAMRCGAAVISSERSSLSQIVNLKEAMFDPGSVSEIAKKIEKALLSRDFYELLKKNADIQSGKFSWKDSALRTLDSIADIVTNEKRDDIAYSPDEYLNGLAVILRGEKNEVFISEIAESISFNLESSGSEEQIFIDSSLLSSGSLEARSFSPCSFKGRKTIYFKMPAGEAGLKDVFGEDLEKSPCVGDIVFARDKLTLLEEAYFKRLKLRGIKVFCVSSLYEDITDLLKLYL